MTICRRCRSTERTASGHCRPCRNAQSRAFAARKRADPVWKARRAIYNEKDKPRQRLRSRRAVILKNLARWQFKMQWMLSNIEDQSRELARVEAALAR